MVALPLFGGFPSSSPFCSPACACVRGAAADPAGASSSRKGLLCWVLVFGFFWGFFLVWFLAYAQPVTSGNSVTSPTCSEVVLASTSCLAKLGSDVIGLGCRSLRQLRSAFLACVLLACTRLRHLCVFADGAGRLQASFLTAARVRQSLGGWALCFLSVCFNPEAEGFSGRAHEGTMHDDSTSRRSK